MLETEGIVCGLVILAADWVTDFGEVGRIELLIAEVFTGDLGESGCVSFNCEVNCCLKTLWDIDTGDLTSLALVFETMLLLAIWGLFAKLYFYGLGWYLYGFWPPIAWDWVSILLSEMSLLGIDFCLSVFFAGLSRFGVWNLSYLPVGGVFLNILLEPETEPSSLL